jgi:hypothetical protein
MTYGEVKRLVKERGYAKYRGTKLVLLTKLTNALYDPDKASDVTGRTISRKVTTLQGYLAGVSDRQLRTIISQIEEIKVVSRKNGTIVFAFDFEKLATGEKTTHKAKRTLAQRAEDRASKARAARAKLRKQRTERKAFQIIGRCFGFVLNGAQNISAETRRKHASLPFRAEKAEAPSAPCAPSLSADSSDIEKPKRRGPIKVATAPCAQ